MSAHFVERDAGRRDEAGLRHAHEIVRRLKEEAKTAYIDDRGTVFNQDVLGALELGYMLDTAEATVGGKIAQLGQRLLAGTAKKTADRFFANFAKALAE